MTTYPGKRANFQCIDDQWDSIILQGCRYKTSVRRMRWECKDALISEVMISGTIYNTTELAFQLRSAADLPAFTSYMASRDDDLKKYQKNWLPIFFSTTGSAEDLRHLYAFLAAHNDFPKDSYNLLHALIKAKGCWMNVSGITPADIVDLRSPGGYEDSQ